MLLHLHPSGRRRQVRLCNLPSGFPASGRRTGENPISPIHLSSLLRLHQVSKTPRRRGDEMPSLLSGTGHSAAQRGCRSEKGQRGLALMELPAPWGGRQAGLALWCGERVLRAAHPPQQIPVGLISHPPRPIATLQLATAAPKPLLNVTLTFRPGTTLQLLNGVSAGPTDTHTDTHTHRCHQEEQQSWHLIRHGR